MNNIMQQLQQKDAYKLLHYGSIAFARAEQQGIRVDVDYLNQKQKELTDDIKKVENKLQNTKFWQEWREARNGQEPNYNSNPQLKYFLYQVKGYEPFKTTVTGAGSTDEESLKQLGIKELDYILRIRKLKKIQNTYIQGLLNEEVHGYVHPFYNLHTARSFRSSSSFPNAQNIPSRDKEASDIVRGGMFPRPGHQLIEADFKSLEVSIAACYTQDRNLLAYLKEGGDMHKDVGKQIFLMDEIDSDSDWGDIIRKATKNGFVFPQFYGDYYKNNAQGICQWVGLPQSGFKKSSGIELWDETHIGHHLRENGIKKYDDLVEHIRKIEEDFWTNRFPDYAQWKEDIWEFYKENGYIDMYTGFRCGGAMRKNEVTNIGIQGSAFHCLLWSFIMVDWEFRKNEWKSRLIGQIHDSMIIDTHPDEFYDVIELVRRVTTVDLPNEWKWIIVPLFVEFETAKVDEPWSKTKKLAV
jgi:DNA polymerase-1